MLNLKLRILDSLHFLWLTEYKKGGGGWTPELGRLIRYHYSLGDVIKTMQSWLQSRFHIFEMNREEREIEVLI